MNNENGYLSPYITYVHINTMKTEIMSFVGEWMELEIIALKINQAEKDKFLMFLLMWNLYLNKKNKT